MTGETFEQKLSILTDITTQSFSKTLLAGFVSGALAGGLTLIFTTYVFKVMPCYAETCGAGGQYAAILAGIVSAMVALFWMIRLQIFRPLLVVMAVTIGLWGISLYILNWPWYYVVLVSAGLHAVAYGLFAWLSRIRIFWVVIALLIIIIAGLRFVLLNS
jgi:hypothetical protein